MKHREIRAAVLSALKENIVERVTWFDGRPALLYELELPAVAVYLTDASAADEFVDEDTWRRYCISRCFSGERNGFGTGYVDGRENPSCAGGGSAHALLLKMNLQGYDYRRDDEFMMWGSARSPVENYLRDVRTIWQYQILLSRAKGSGTTLWVYTGTGDAYANPLSDDEWTRLAKIKDLTPGEMTAESYDDNDPHDEDADWVSTGQGQKSAGDTSFTLAWKPGEKGQRDLIACLTAVRPGPTKSVSRTARWMCSVAG